MSVSPALIILVGVEREDHYCTEQSCLQDKKYK